MSWLASCIAVPAALCFWSWLLAAAPRRWGCANTRVYRRLLLRYTGVLAELGSVVVWLAVPATLVSGLSCWQRRRGTTQIATTRIDRPTRDFTLYQRFGRASLCRALTLACSCSEYAVFFGLGCLQRGRGAGKAQRREMIDNLRAISLYRGFGRAGLCRGRNPA